MHNMLLSHKCSTHLQMSAPVARRMRCQAEDPKGNFNNFDPQPDMWESESLGAAVQVLLLLLVTCAQCQRVKSCLGLHVIPCVRRAC